MKLPKNIPELTVNEYKAMYETIKFTHSISQDPNHEKGKVLLCVKKIIKQQPLTFGDPQYFLILSDNTIII